LLSAGTPVEVLERQGPWIRVRVEGWLRAASVEAPLLPPAAPLAAAPAVAPPAVAPPEVPRPSTADPGGTVEGAVRVQLRRLKPASGAGALVWLLPAAARDELERESLSEQEVERLQALEAEAVALQEQAARAMHLPNFTEATRKSDALRARRSAALEERGQILATRHGRHEALARRAAVGSVVADSRGWFSLGGTRPGAYTIYSRMVREDLDLEWIERIEVSAAGTVRVDLNETTARGLLREPS
jgi:hypothetical protein